MTVLKEFRVFIARGNVMDIVIGVIMGAAFGKIIASLVTDVVLPPTGLFLSGVDFSALEIVLRPADAATRTAMVAIRLGAFINTIIQFLILAAAIFVAVKAMNALRRPAPAAAAEPVPASSPSEALLTEIRDLLAARTGSEA